MIRITLPALSLALAIGSATAQDATVPAATVDVTIANSRLGQAATVTYVLGAAQGDDFDGATIVARADDEITFGDAVAVANESGACDVGAVEVTASLSPPFDFAFPPQTQALEFVSACPFPASAPFNLPTCGPGDELYTASGAASTTISLASSPLPLPNGTRIAIDISIAASGSGCTTVPTTATANFVIDNSAPVPVELLNFAGERLASGDLLLWTVANEVDLAGYAVQRSRDGTAFETVAFVDARGTAGGPRDYREAVGSDGNGGTAPSYYRLRSVDLDGSAEVSHVVVLSGPATDKPSVTLASNYAFVGAGWLLTSIKNSTGATDRVRVYAADGRVAGTYSARAGTSIGTDLPAGIYLIHIGESAGATPLRAVLR